VDDAGDRDPGVGVADESGPIDPQGIGAGGDFDDQADFGSYGMTLLVALEVPEDHRKVGFRDAIAPRAAWQGYGLMEADMPPGRDGRLERDDPPLNRGGMLGQPWLRVHKDPVEEHDFVLRTE